MRKRLFRLLPGTARLLAQLISEADRTLTSSFQVDELLLPRSLASSPPGASCHQPLQ